MSRPLIGWAVALVCAASGCSQLSSHVESEESALGRVVVYRNGIAYFERRAQVAGDRLVLRVPHDKVDDFLKSLTVSDAKTGKPFPVSFPTRRAAAGDGMADMVIQLPKEAQGEVVLSYITDSPAWKPSYRLVVGDDGQVRVQGWAIVDNTSGEDWQSVRLGVGSSSALSFRYDLRTVRLVHRETLSDQQRFALAPPRGGAVHGGARPQNNRRVVGALADNDIPRPDGHPDMVADAPETVARTTGNKRGAPSARPTARRGKRDMRRQQNARQVDQLAARLKKSKKKITIEGYSSRGERNAPARARDRANVLRNELIRRGVPPAQLAVKVKGVVAGKNAGVELVEDEQERTVKGQSKTTPDGRPIGESHFESVNTMTVARGTSALVSILDGETKGRVVYLYDPEARRGNKRFAFKAVRFVNPTDSTLESGPVTVYGNTRFVGEGLSEPIPPRSTAFVPYAMDRQVMVDRRGSTGDQISRLITVHRGVLTAEMQHTKRTKLTIANRGTGSASVYIRHHIPEGWKLLKGPKLSERMGESHLFRVDIAGGETEEVVIEEATPIVRTVDLRSDIGLSLVKVYLQAPEADKQFGEPMRKLLTLHTEMANIQQRIEGTREQMDEYRERIDELHRQIVHLKEVKTKGGRLLRHLQTKMVQTSERLQKATIAVVDLQEQLTMARIQFQDGVSELTLGNRATAQAAVPSNAP